MKILRIAGRNLASLAGPFEVDFRSEPLASCGLFAISGPTGAGKSTLLDALCVALYDATPRLARAGARGVALPDVGDETVTPHDTRNLLRRGAAEGHAEVDFIGNDGQSYQARWSVRRARGKADGSLQKTAMSLIRLPDGQPIGGTYSEVKAEIRQRIGLSFEQFTRAVLLAQNEFAAFLKADDNERGELLETLTGSALYTAISRLAYQRAKQEHAQWQRLAERLGEQQPLDTEQRLRLETEVAQAAAALAALESRQAALEREWRWRQDQVRLAGSEAQALAACERAEAALEEAGASRRRLALVEAVQEARPLLADAWRIEQELVDAGKAREATAAAMDRSREARRAAEAALQAAESGLAEAESRARALAPALEQARALDARLLAGAPVLEQARQALAETVAAAKRARDKHAGKLAQREQEWRAQCEGEAWLDGHRGWQALSAQWPRCDMLLSQAGDAQRLLTGLEQEREAACRGRDGCEREALAAQAALAEAVHQLEASAARRMQAEQAAAAHDGAALLAAKDAAEARRALLADGAALSAHLAELSARGAGLQAREREANAALLQAEAGLEAARAAQAGLDGARAQAARSLRLAEAAAGENVESLRASLEEDIPCPVCGSRDHPYRTEAPQWHAALASLRDEAARSQRLAEQNLALQSAHTARAEAARAQLAQIASEGAGLAPALEETQRGWQAHPLAKEAGIRTDEERAAWFATRQEEMAQCLRDLGRREQAWRAALAEQESSRAAAERAAASHAASQEAAARAGLALARAEAAANALTGRRDEARQRLEAALAGLDGLVGQAEWQAHWRTDTSAFHEARRQQVEQWREREAAQARRQILLDQIDIGLQALAAVLAQAGEDEARAARMLARAEQERDALRRERAGLLEGQPAIQVEQGLEQAASAARAVLAQAGRSLRQAGETHARHGEALAQASQRQASQSAAAADALERLERWLEAFNGAGAGEGEALDRQRLDALLEHDAAWIALERSRLQAIASARDSAAAVLRERREQRAAHLLAAPPGERLEAAALETALAALSAERATATERAAALRLELAQDDARRRQSAATRAELEAQEASSRRWAQLNELIGSADGKKFRNVAQRYTLDVLLAHANRHLRDLARRYRLERIGDSLALMVVDQDMGDEPRSVHSLSGGESFLVALALALGLASLSSDRVRVESLFIDEGFGSLDAETLRVAMDALDTLQAMGRKVGVISHVQEMADRIGTRITVKKTALGRSQLSVA